MSGGDPTLDKVDASRRTVALLLGIASIIIFLMFSGWAFCSAERFLDKEISAYALLAKAIVFGTVVGFCYGLLKLADRLATPLVTLARIEEAKANRSGDAPKKEGGQFVTVNLPRDLSDFIAMGKES